MSGSSLNTYNEWIANTQTQKYKDWKMNVKFDVNDDTERPPSYSHDTLFHELVEDYAMDMTTVPTEDVKRVATATKDNDMFAPCMVGTLESQYLKMQVNIAGASRILDVGTFTGMSALAMAEGIASKEGKVVTLEFDDKIADVAEQNFRESKVANKIELMRGRADDNMKLLIERGEKFDIVFIDADKEGYINYYEIAMSGLLADNGFIMVDNTLSALIYLDEDERTKKLHEFNQHVRRDKRVNQVVVTAREGITIIRPVSAFLH